MKMIILYRDMKKMVMWITKIYGAELGNRLVIFDTKVQQSLSRLLNKTQRNLNGDNSLDGLEIDWHLANTERMFDNFVEPVMDSQPTYAYAA
jgi:hypothetical protein